MRITNHSMDIVLLIIVIGLLVWVGISLASHQLKNAGSKHVPHAPLPQSPYQKAVERSQIGWEAVRQQKELIKRKALLRDAVEKGDHTQAKVQKSMMVFGKSVLGHMREKARSKSSS